VNQASETINTGTEQNGKQTRLLRLLFLILAGKLSGDEVVGRIRSGRIKRPKRRVFGPEWMSGVRGQGVAKSSGPTGESSDRNG
jgi:hypothetical protein